MPKINKAQAKAGVGTILSMHVTEKCLEEAKKHHIQMIQCSHMASDALGVNLLLDKIRKSEPKMKFIEMSGKTLLLLVNQEELAALHSAGINEHSLVRVNPQGDVEVRMRHKWEVLGGLLGDFDARVRKATGLDWA